MATKTISIRMDEDLYRDFAKFAADVHIPVSALVASFAATTVKRRRIPFEITPDPFYSLANQERIARAIDRLEAGQGAEHDLLEA
ncbi:MAG: hypothetical protein LBG60_02735 [Bifidobacteriaceae bacterium]|nr:hypothetical protein [Bifidobacteriaceae bacterium]